MMSLISNGLKYTQHAVLRMSQRGISKEDIALVIQKGTWHRKTGVIFIIMRQKNIKTKDEERLKNLTVVLAKDGSNILTVYKNKRSLRDIKRKSKKNLSSEEQKWRQSGTT